MRSTAAPNAATAFLERVWAAFDLSDLEAAEEPLATARAHFSPDFVWEDRRPIVGLSGGLDLMIASARGRLASGARHQRRTIVGTAGDRVAVGRILWAGGPPAGRFEVEFLAVHEVNETGLCTALIFFDPDDEAPRPTKGAPTLEEVKAKLVEFVAEVSGYPPQIFDEDLDLEVDLGIDSIKQVQTLGRVREHYGLAMDEGFMIRDYATIKKLADYIVSRPASGV